jgi:hypothetical protein
MRRKAVTPRRSQDWLLKKCLQGGEPYLSRPVGVATAPLLSIQRLAWIGLLARTALQLGRSSRRLSPRGCVGAAAAAAASSASSAACRLDLPMVCVCVYVCVPGAVRVHGDGHHHGERRHIHAHVRARRRAGHVPGQLRARLRRRQQVLPVSPPDYTELVPPSICGEGELLLVQLQMLGEHQGVCTYASLQRALSITQ